MRTFEYGLVTLMTVLLVLAAASYAANGIASAMDDVANNIAAAQQRN
jgi:hypothetical protein